MNKVIVGVDEAGRGAFFGRIYSAAAVACPSDNGVVIRDSKKMTPRQRSLTFDYLCANTRYGIGWCDEKEIDELGVGRCNILSMHRALSDLLARHSVEIEKILVDGVLFEPFRGIPYETVVRGEDAHLEIATASILAKVSRDRFIVGMCDEDEALDEKYDLRRNKGYGTARHIAGLREHGPHASHRRSFIRNHCGSHLRFLA
jgi:ribonuclease HII